jgi:hypothetical protein
MYFAAAVSILPEVHVTRDDKSLFCLVQSFRPGPPLATRVPTRIRRNGGRRNRTGEGAKEERQKKRNPEGKRERQGVSEKEGT